jgi:AraC-like DNA-binding protein
MLTSSAPSQAGASLWPAALILWGRGARSSAHCHHCIQVHLALSGTVRARSGPGTRWRRCAAVVVAPDVRHEIDSGEGPVLIGFFDPESELAASLWAQMAAEITVVSDAVAGGASLATPAKSTGHASIGGSSPSFSATRRPRPLHPAVQRTLKYLRNGGLQHRRLSANGVSQIAQLSPSRFQHVFTESLGIPLRPYVRWLRVQLAMGALAAGCPITEAAHGAGFADAAHLTRTLRRTLGHTPGELVRKCVLRREVHRTTFS